MKLSTCHIALLQYGSVLAIWPRLGHDPSRIRLTAPIYGKFPNNLDGVETESINFTPIEMLDHKSQKPELYELALIDLKKLGKESTCHHIATKLYMSTCQIFQEVEDPGKGDIISRRGGRLQDYIDSFAISRAICDLETAHATIPHVCEAFREPVLQSIMNSKGARGLEISHEQIGLCMKGLHSDQKSWTSYNSNKDSAALLCRASRLDIDKDDLISTAQVVVNILREVVLADEQRKADQAEADLTTKLQFQRVHEEVSNLKDRLSGLWSQVSEEYTGVAKILVGLLRKASGDIEATNLAMKRILINLMEGNAEHALAQENSIAATSGLVMVAQSAAGAMMNFRSLMEEVGFNMSAMSTALAVIEQRHSDVIDMQDAQVRELLKDVREELQDVRKLTLEVKANAENTARWMSKWAMDMLPTGPWGISWPLLILTPVMNVVLVGHGVPASYSRNIGLAIIGIPVAKFLTLAINMQWDMNAIYPSSFSQLARERFSSPITTTPISLDLQDRSAVLGSRLLVPTDI